MSPFHYTLFSSQSCQVPLVAFCCSESLDFDAGCKGTCRGSSSTKALQYQASRLQRVGNFGTHIMAFDTECMSCLQAHLVHEGLALTGVNALQA